MLSWCDMSKSLPTMANGFASCDLYRNLMLSPAQRFSRVHGIALFFGFPAAPSAVFTKSPSHLHSVTGLLLQSTDIIHRPTSRPYAGDLSVFRGPERDTKLQVNRVMDLLGIHAGSGVADIGAGSGWFSVRAARRVGSSGRVYSVDINRSYLRLHPRSRPKGEPPISASSEQER